MKKAPQLSKEKRAHGRSSFPILQKAFSSPSLVMTKRLNFLFLFKANRRGEEGRRGESLKCSSFNYAPLFVIFIAFL